MKCIPTPAFPTYMWSSGANCHLKATGIRAQLVIFIQLGTLWIKIPEKQQLTLWICSPTTSDVVCNAEVMLPSKSLQTPSSQNIQHCPCWTGTKVHTVQCFPQWPSRCHQDKSRTWRPLFPPQCFSQLHCLWRWRLHLVFRAYRNWWGYPPWISLRSFKKPSKLITITISLGSGFHKLITCSMKKAGTRQK